MERVSSHADSARAGQPYLLAPPTASAGFALPDAFWSRFHDEYWEKRGAVLAQPFAMPIATPRETFDCLVEAAERFRAGDRRVSLGFYIDHTQQLADVGRYLPDTTDTSATAYADRVTTLLGGRKFGLVVDDFQAIDGTVWLRARDFLRGLFEHTGLPGESAKATVFLSNYDSTPFGLHRGRAGTFTFVVDGQKRMRTWPDAFFRGKEDLTSRLDYQQYNSESIVLDADPGDVIYWPSDHWHIAESVEGGLSMTVSIALFMDHLASADLLTQARGMVERRLAADAPTESFTIFPGWIGDSPAAIGRVVDRATAALRDVSQDPGLHARLLGAWLNHVSAFGFTTAPSPLAPAHLDDIAVVRGRPEYPVIWKRIDNGQLICSANGHSFTLIASPTHLELLEWVNRGAPHRVDGLIADHAGVSVAGGVRFETTPVDIRTLLEKLLSLRAITLEP